MFSKCTLLFISLIGSAFHVSTTDDGGKEELVDLSLSVARDLQTARYFNVRNHFLDGLLIGDTMVTNVGFERYRNVLSDLEIAGAEVMQFDTAVVDLGQLGTDLSSVQVVTAYVGMGINPPSVVPTYFLAVHTVEHNSRYKLVGLKLVTTENVIPKSPPKIENSIDINPEKVVKVTSMYEGGYKHKDQFLVKEFAPHEAIKYKEKIEGLVRGMNNSTIVRSQHEQSTRKFNGDPEMNIIHLDLNDGYTYTIFKLISHEPDKPEEMYGDYEIRYYEYLNNAVTYWVTNEDEKHRIDQVFKELCKLGTNEIEK